MCAVAESVGVVVEVAVGPLVGPAVDVTAVADANMVLSKLGVGLAFVVVVVVVAPPTSAGFGEGEMFPGVGTSTSLEVGSL